MKAEILLFNLLLRLAAAEVTYGDATPFGKGHKLNIYRKGLAAGRYLTDHLEHLEAGSGRSDLGKAGKIRARQH